MGVHLAGVQLTGMHLAGVYLAGVHLAGIYLTGVHLKNRRASGRHLAGICNAKIKICIPNIPCVTEIGPYFG